MNSVSLKCHHLILHFLELSNSLRWKALNRKGEFVDCLTYISPVPNAFVCTT